MHAALNTPSAGITLGIAARPDLLADYHFNQIGTVQIQLAMAHLMLRRLAA